MRPGRSYITQHNPRGSQPAEAVTSWARCSKIAQAGCGLGQMAALICSTGGLIALCTTITIRVISTAWGMILCIRSTRTARACCGWHRARAEQVQLAANRFTLYTRLPNVPAVLPEMTATDTGHLLETSGLQSLSSQRVMAVHEDHEGNLWVGMLDGGLNRLDRTAGTLTVYRYDPANPNSLSSDTVRDIYQDRNGRLWVGPDSGLDQFEFRQRHIPQELVALGF